MAYVYKLNEMARLKYVRQGRGDVWRPGAVVEVVRLDVEEFYSGDGKAVEYVVQVVGTHVVGGVLGEQLEPYQRPKTVSWAEFAIATGSGWNPLRTEEEEEEERSEEARLRAFAQLGPAPELRRVNCRCAVAWPERKP